LGSAASVDSTLDNASEVLNVHGAPSQMQEG